MSIFALKAHEKHLHRLYRQHDALAKSQDETARQLDSIAAEIEQTRIAISLTKMDRDIVKPVPVKIEFC